MRPSVDSPQLTPRSDDAETQRLANECRRRLNDRFRQVFTTTTRGTGAWTTVLSQQMPLTGTWTAWGIATGRARTGDGRMTVWRCATFYREGGGATQQGATTDVAVHRNIAALDFRFNINGTSVEWQVEDDGVRTVDWAVECSYQEIPRS